MVTILPVSETTIGNESPLLAVMRAQTVQTIVGFIATVASKRLFSI